MSAQADNLFAARDEVGKLVAYYRKLLADSSTSPLLQELARKNLAALEGGTYSIDWDRLERIYTSSDQRLPRPPLSEVMDKPDAVQDVLPPQTQQTKEQSRQEIFDGFAEAAHEHRQQQIEEEQHDPNRAMNEAEDNGIPF